MATLSHAALMSGLFVTLAEGVRRTWPWSSSTVATVERASAGSIRPATGD
jgi:hypothetical protein